MGEVPADGRLEDLPWVLGRTTAASLAWVAVSAALGRGLGVSPVGPGAALAGPSVVVTFLVVTSAVAVVAPFLDRRQSLGLPGVGRQSHLAEASSLAAASSQERATSLAAASSAVAQVVAQEAVLEAVLEEKTSAEPVGC